MTDNHNPNQHPNQGSNRRVLSAAEIAAQAQQPRPRPKLNPEDIIKTKEYKAASRRYVALFLFGCEGGRGDGENEWRDDGEGKIDADGYI